MKLKVILRRITSIFSCRILWSIIYLAQKLTKSEHSILSEWGVQNKKKEETYNMTKSKSIDFYSTAYAIKTEDRNTVIHVQKMLSTKINVFSHLIPVMGGSRTI